MLERSCQLFAQTLNVLLFAVSIGLAVALWGKPASVPFVLKAEPATTGSVLKREPTAPSAAPKGKPTATTPAAPPLEINCRIGLASCRKWIALHERKGRVLVHSAQR